MPARHALLVLAALFAGLTCATGPQPIVAGDPCARCHMPVADERWGAELITGTGVVRKYDSPECLAHDLVAGVVASADVGSVWVVPYDAPGTLIPAGSAMFLRSTSLRSPMGLGITAFRDETERDAVRARHGGELLAWADVIDLAGKSPTHRDHHDADAR